MSERPESVIRRGEPSDAQTLAPFASRIFVETFGDGDDPVTMGIYIADAFNVPQISSELSDPDNVFFIARIGDEIAGYVKLRRSDRHRDELPDCVTSHRPMELCRCYVARKWHGQGIGDALMAHSLDEASRQACDLVWLGVYENNVRAVRFYARWGFLDIGTHIFQFGPEAQTDRVMVKQLTVSFWQKP